MPDVPPSPKRSEPWRPFITGQRADNGGTVLVRFALPGLREATLRVPGLSWVEGEHLRVTDALADFVGSAEAVTDDEPYTATDAEGEPSDDYPGDY